MKSVVIAISLLASVLTASAQAESQDEWVIKAEDFVNSTYYGVTVANGMIGMVSSKDPFKIGEVVLAGVYDYYKRGRIK